ncbi:TolC family protein [Kiritimatiellaeota bacterium B1221]|nr:TolC family protein [Kiritimatiellaeota bacterium B1221]
MHFIYKHRHSIVILFMGLWVTLFAQETGAPPGLTFDEALARVLKADPRLSLMQARLEEARGVAEQAGLAPNPALETEVENIFGTGPFEGMDAAETTLTYVQELETAGKRRLRTAVAENDLAALEVGLETLQLRMVSETRTAFDRVVLAQRRNDLRQREQELARQSLQETELLLEAASVSAVEVARARLALRERDFAVRQSGREVLSARKALANLWGESDLSTFQLVGRIDLMEPPDPDRVEMRMGNHPGLRQLDAGRKLRAAELDLEEARAIPNVEVFAGIKHTREDDGDTAFLVGLGLPLPLFNRNQGNIRAARARVNALEWERDTLRRELLLEIRGVWRELSSAFDDARELRELLLPAAEDTFAQTQAGYREGRYPLLNVLESRQALYDIQEAELEALERYIRARATLERLTATTETHLLHQ